MNADLVEKTISLNNHAMHLRPVQRIVETAGKFKSEIRVEHPDYRANAKSILDLIMFGASLAEAGATHFVLRVDGDDRNEAMGALSDLMDELFGKPGALPGTTE